MSKNIKNQILFTLKNSNSKITTDKLYSNEVHHFN